jgi:AcrR family transcriptional regulator
LSATSLDSLLPPRQERRGDATRRRILDAAESEFAAKGFDGARLAAIARAADTPQALIHHYCDDKAGLYAAVIERALGSIAAEGWRILETLAPPRRRSRTKRFELPELRALIEALVGMMVDFSATHAPVLRILRLEADRGGKLLDELLRVHVRPQVDDLVMRLEQMRRRREVREDIDPRRLCLSAISMACFPYQEAAFVASVWSFDPKDLKFSEDLKREILATLMARIAP